MKNNISIFNDYIILNDTLIKIKNICLIRPNPNRFIGGIDIYITGSNVITMEHVNMYEFPELDFPFIKMDNLIINPDKIIAFFPIPKPRTYPGLYIFFEGTNTIDLPFIESKNIIDLIKK